MRMPKNLTSPNAKYRCTCPMRAHDKLPAALRCWLAQAALPWSARSVLKIWNEAMKAGGEAAALDRLHRAERATLQREAPLVWGQGYPTLSPAAT